MNLVIQQHHDLQHAVDAKQLYTELGLDKSNWAKWSQRNITNNEFALEYADYVGFVQTTNGNSTQNFLLSIPFAKKLAMQVKTQKGEDVRNYFLECEQKAQQPQIALPNFTDPAAAAEAWAKEYREKQALAITLEQAQPKINHYDKVVERKNLLNATQVGEKLDGMNKLSQACNFCNNTSEHCCTESDKNYEARAHIIDAQDEHHHDEADAHVFMLNGLLVAKDVPMPKAGV